MKKVAVLVFSLVCALCLTGCSRSMNDIIENEPSITGIVEKITNDAFLMANETGEYWVSLKVENQDSMTHFSIGDEVVVYYDGTVAESYPMQINTVYAITLQTPADRTQNDQQVLDYFAGKYDTRLKLWGPEGQDLYVFCIYPDHAERECHILMPANTEDAAQYHKDLSWQVEGDKLIITGQWQETFRIDMEAETATSTATEKIYQIYPIEPPLE